MLLFAITHTTAFITHLTPLGATCFVRIHPSAAIPHCEASAATRQKAEEAAERALMQHARFGPLEARRFVVVSTLVMVVESPSKQQKYWASGAW